MTETIDYLLVRDGRLEVFFFALAYLALSLTIGAVFRRNIPEALFMGFLVLAAGSNLCLYVFRGLRLDLTAFAAAAVFLSLLIAGLLRVSIDAKGAFDFRLSPVFILTAGPLLAAIWFSQVLMTEPAAGMSSHQAWYPLYLTESFNQGYFLTHADMRFAPGFLGSLLFATDLAGIAALGAWIGAENGYAPFLAAAIAAGISCAALLVHGLRRDPVASIGFGLFFLVYFRLDPDFRLLIGANWGDVLMYMSGVGVMYYLMAADTTDGDIGTDGYVLAAAAALILPFSRTYGIFYAFVICAVCLALHWRRRGGLDWRVWGGVFVLGCVISSREIYNLINAVSPYYQSGRYLFKFAHSQWGLLVQNIGIDIADRRPLIGQALYGAYLAVAAAGIGMYFLKKTVRRIPLDVLLAPLVLILAPSILMLLTAGYSALGYSKLFGIAIFLHVYYPWRVLAVSGLGRDAAAFLARYRLPLGGAVLAALIGGAVVSADKIRNHRIVRDGIGPTLDCAFETYRLNNVDLLIARKLRDRPQLLSVLRTRPVLYFHYEPGLTLRYFVGGNLFSDLDFWSNEVYEAMAESRSFEETVERLGNPVIYISYMTGFSYAGFAPDDRWKKFSSEILDLDRADWIADTVSISGARLYFPKAALNAAPSQPKRQ